MSICNGVWVVRVSWPLASIVALLQRQHRRLCSFVFKSFLLPKTLANSSQQPQTTQFISLLNYYKQQLFGSHFSMQIFISAISLVIFCTNLRLFRIKLTFCPVTFPQPCCAIWLGHSDQVSSSDDVQTVLLSGSLSIPSTIKSEISLPDSAVTEVQTVMKRPVCNSLKGWDLPDRLPRNASERSAICHAELTRAILF